MIGFLTDQIAQSTRQSQYGDMRILELASIRAMLHQRQLKCPYARMAKGKSTYFLNALRDDDRRENAIRENTADPVFDLADVGRADFYESLRKFKLHTHMD